eukprot:CAMPEP_0195140848 /NCGR_PEP_ID=MMETSP0448-20130528/161914_1 /TAXON_ID=66468 /ORGANISM="Heterocapsa triquestra, Strain CCMP 448" /LENGTH=47 /DNA_ID= /DNA_START= /DNA_END= /DNA_ORIENTATION=
MPETLVALSQDNECPAEDAECALSLRQLRRERQEPFVSSHGSDAKAK